MTAFASRLVFLIASVLLACAGLACGGGGDTFEEKTVSADGKDELVVNLSYGELKVKGKDGATDVVVTPSTALTTAEATYTVSEDGSTIAVQVINLSGNTDTVDLTITIPPEMKHNLIVIEEGGVTLSDVEAGGTINTEKGDIDLTLNSGFVTENVNATTGDITATFPSDFTGVLTATTDDGELTVDGLDVEESDIEPSTAANVDIGGGGDDKLTALTAKGNISISGR